jgi:hypothetical protein
MQRQPRDAEAGWRPAQRRPCGTGNGVAGRGTQAGGGWQVAPSHNAQGDEAWWFGVGDGKLQHRGSTTGWEQAGGQMHVLEEEGCGSRV